MIALQDAKQLVWGTIGAAAALARVLVVMTSCDSLFLASIGGSVVFLFALTDAPAAQPRALFGGHLASASVGVVCLQMFGSGPASMVITALISMLVMVMTRTVHPSAGANPLLVIHSGAAWCSLLLPIAASLVFVSLVAIVWSRLRPGIVYPQAWAACSPPRRIAG